MESILVDTEEVAYAGENNPSSLRNLEEIQSMFINL